MFCTILSIQIMAVQWIAAESLEKLNHTKTQHNISAKHEKSARFIHNHVKWLFNALHVHIFCVVTLTIFMTARMYCSMSLRPW